MGLVQDLNLIDTDFSSLSNCSAVRRALNRLLILSEYIVVLRKVRSDTTKKLSNSIQTHDFASISHEFIKDT